MSPGAQRPVWERGELPVFAARERYASALREGGAVVVSAPTGSGKSTCLPPWTVEVAAGPVLVVEPRRVACRALALYLARERGEEVGEWVGYRVRFDDRVGPKTRLSFVTPGVALNLAAAGELGRYAAVIVDEFHERSWEIDLLVALLRDEREGPRLILCSATLAGEALSAELGARYVAAEGRSFPVEIEHRGEGAPSERRLEERVAEAVLELAPRRPGDLLVFLPGKGEIERCKRELAGRGCSAELVAVHGGVDPRRLVDAFSPVEDRQRVFLATNVAESSLTLPGVRTVIDAGLARMRLHRGGRSILALAAIARDSMEQRAGRAGRVAAGLCRRLWAERFEARPYTAPEIERIELDDLILRAAACGLEGRALEAAPWVSPPPEFALAAARERLSAAGALDEGLGCTAMGRRLRELPVSAERARMLRVAPPELAGSLADLVALLEQGRGLFLALDAVDAPRREAVDEARAALLRELPPGQRDEVHVGLWTLARGHARSHGLRGATLKEARRLAAALRKLVDAPARSRDEALPPAGALAGLLLERVPELAFVRRREGRRGRGPSRSAWANGEIELGLRDYEAPGLLPDERDPPAKAGLILDHEWIGVGARARGSGRWLLPCSFEALASAGLGELELVAPTVASRGREPLRVEAGVERKLAGVVIESGSRVLSGAPLRRVLAEMILEGRRLPGLDTHALTRRIHDELHLWDLLAQTAAGPLAGEVPAIAAPPTAQAWLERRLGEQGLEQAEELALLEADDLCPGDRLATLARELEFLGRREWTRASLAEDFPRTWVDRDARYRCKVELERRRVTLEPDDALARKRGEPKPDLLPRFRGFSRFYRQASRRVELR